MSLLVATGVMTTTFITASDASGTEGEKHSMEGWIKEHNEVKTAASNQSGCKMCKRTFHKGKKVNEREMKETVAIHIDFYGSVFQPEHFQSGSWVDTARTAPVLQAQKRQIREKQLIVEFIAQV